MIDSRPMRSLENDMSLDTVAEMGAVPATPVERAQGSANPSKSGSDPRVAGPAAPSGSVGYFESRVSSSLHGAFGDFVRLAGVEPAVALFGAFAALVQRYTGEPETRLAVRHSQAVHERALRSQEAHASAGETGNACVRERVGWENVTLSFEDDPTFAEVLECALPSIVATRGRPEADAMSNAESVDGRDVGTAGRPRFAFDLNLDSAAPVWTARDSSNGDQHSDTAEAEFALRIRCVESRDKLCVGWTYDRTVYDAASIERMARHYERLIACAIAEPRVPVARLTIISSAERQERIRAGRSTARFYERNASICDVFERQARATPDAPAVSDVDVSLTYAELNARANRLANYLAAAGVAAGARVGVTFDRSIDLPVALLAILKAGAAYVPLDPSYPPERLALMIADAAIGWVIARDSAGDGMSLRGRTVRLDREAAAIAAADGRCAPARVGPDACAYVTYTSGSTGRPKGVVVVHRGVVRLVRGIDYLTIASADGFLQHAPLAFDASTFEIWAPLLNGARLGVPRAGLLTMPDLAEAMVRLDVTTMFLTTALFGRLVECALPAFGRLRVLLTGGEIASPAHMRRFLQLYPETRLIAVYGPTENTTFSTWAPLPNAAAIGTSVPIGRPIAHSSAYVVDAHGELAPVGVPGELWVGGDGVAAAYLNLPAVSRERFGPDPFFTSAAERIYKTGDRVCWRADDVLSFIGRTDDQVKIRGFRIELGEIESVLQAHPGVRAAAVVAALADGDKALFAYVAADAGAAMTEAVLRDHLGAKLPRYMLPQRIVIMPALPESASGKVDRIALSRLAERPVAEPRAAAARTQPRIPRPRSAGRELAETIADIWREALGLDRRPQFDDNFFDAGGDSLRLLTVHARLAAHLTIDLPIMTLFEFPTIRALAAKLTELTAR